MWQRFSQKKKKNAHGSIVYNKMLNKYLKAQQL